MDFVSREPCSMRPLCLAFFTQHGVFKVAKHKFKRSIFVAGPSWSWKANRPWRMSLLEEQRPLVESW